jgi:hypothetical protein
LCGSETKYRFCRKCKERKSNATAIVSQNKKKLKRLLDENSITLEWMEKFILYTNNIIRYGKIVMEYKEKDTSKRFVDVMKIGVVACWLISCVFIFEIAII